MPAARPVITPAASIVAVATGSVVHAPPVTAFVRFALVPGQMAVSPSILPGVGAAFTFMAVLLDELPQLFATVYAICAMPAPLADTLPAASIVAIAGASVVHSPPFTVLLSNNDVPAHAADPPLIDPASGTPFTVISRVVIAVPQPLVTT